MAVSLFCVRVSGALRLTGISEQGEGQFGSYAYPGGLATDGVVGMAGERDLTWIRVTQARR